MSLEIYKTEVTVDRVTIDLRDNPAEDASSVRLTLVLPNQPNTYDFDMPLALAHLEALRGVQELIETKIRSLQGLIRLHPGRFQQSDHWS